MSSLDAFGNGWTTEAGLLEFIDQKWGPKLSSVPAEAQPPSLGDMLLAIKYFKDESEVEPLSLSGNHCEILQTPGIQE